MRRWGCIPLIICAQISFAQPTEIRMMAGTGMGIPPKEATDPRSIARRAVFDEFHRTHPDIKVVNAGGLEMTGERAESMFLMSMAGANPPDVFYVNFRQYYNYIDQGFCRRLDDLADETRINPVVQDVLKSYDGHYYAVPFFQVAMGLYFRRDHFREAGLDPAQPPRTWEELYAFSKRIHDANPGRYGFAFSKGAGYHWSNFIFQAGGEIIHRDPDGQSRATIQGKPGELALEFFRKMVGGQGAPAIVTSQFREMIREGKVSMWLDYSGDVITSMAGNTLDPSVVGITSMPSGPVSNSHEVNAGCWAINATITDAKKLQACRQFVQYFAGQQAARINTKSFVEQGMATFVNPRYLKEFGYEQYLGEVDPSYARANAKIFEGGHPEPYGRNTAQVYVALDNALDRAIQEPQTPAATVLKDAEAEMNDKLLNYVPPSLMQIRRAWAIGITVAAAATLGGWGWFALRRPKRKWINGPKRRPDWRFIGLALLPAVLSLLMWAYYPLSRGLVMAFQDYRIVKGPEWVGLDNFIAVFTQPIFYKAVVNSFVFVGLSILIGFLLPILLAIGLNEIPRFGTLFRTLFYLPAMTSGIVISLLWRQFYDKSEAGLLNQMVKPFVQGINQVFGQSWPLSYDWLGSPQLAMLAVVLPGIWAAAGPGSILYLAALKNIPEERYEAADLDGASWVTKITRIIIPGLRPLMLINLLGVFIGGFKAMENIFVLTLGGPMYATHTLGLEVWTNAFMYLRFGYATAAGWVMGAILIGFTVIQIRSLLNMKFVTVRS